VKVNYALNELCCEAQVNREDYREKPRQRLR
jgi:hypothetical protein